MMVIENPFLSTATSSQTPQEDGVYTSSLHNSNNPFLAPKTERVADPVMESMADDLVCKFLRLK